MTSTKFHAPGFRQRKIITSWEHRFCVVAVCFRSDYYFAVVSKQNGCLRYKYPIIFHAKLVISLLFQTIGIWSTWAALKTRLLDSPLAKIEISLTGVGRVTPLIGVLQGPRKFEQMQQTDTT